MYTSPNVVRSVVYRTFVLALYPSMGLRTWKKIQQYHRKSIGVLGGSSIPGKYVPHLQPEVVVKTQVRAWNLAESASSSADTTITHTTTTVDISIIVAATT